MIPARGALPSLGTACVCVMDDVVQGMLHEVRGPYAWEFSTKGLVHWWDDGWIVDFVPVRALK